ncbi:MAG: GNAT family N-acetyltransferase [Anaerorhabdus sp.]
MKMIKEADKNDIENILLLIKELARYEDRLDEVTATKEDLEYWIFKENKAKIILIYEDNTIAGYAVYFYSFSTYSGTCKIYIEDLYIKNEYRKKGYGEALINYIMVVAKNKRIAKVEWSCLKNNFKSLDYYHKLGAVLNDESVKFSKKL